jgi:hypothetical protein
VPVEKERGALSETLPLLCPQGTEDANTLYPKENGRDAMLPVSLRKLLLCMRTMTVILPGTGRC